MYAVPGWPRQDRRRDRRRARDARGIDVRCGGYNLKGEVPRSTAHSTSTAASVPSARTIPDPRSAILIVWTPGTDRHRRAHLIGARERVEARVDEQFDGISAGLGARPGRHLVGADDAPARAQRGTTRASVGKEGVDRRGVSRRARQVDDRAGRVESAVHVAPSVASRLEAAAVAPPASTVEAGFESRRARPPQARGDERHQDHKGRAPHSRHHRPRPGPR